MGNVDSPGGIGVPDPAAPVLRVVVLGASAGGLEAMQEVLDGIDAMAGSALLVAQHLAPDHPSTLTALLATGSGLPVEDAVDGSALTSGLVLVIPPNHDATIEGDRLRLVAPVVRTTPSPSIDRLLASLASEWGPRAVGVVLSGTGTDGAQGIRAVQAAGGLTLVQTPSTAKFDGMPRAAIEMGGADLILDARDIGGRLGELSQDPDDGFQPTVAAVSGGALSRMSARLRHVTGIDFAAYKSTTVSRQLLRRMALRRVHDTTQYLAILDQDADEARALADKLLVTVTSFFRDAEAFDALRTCVEEYVSSMDAGDILRVWVPGCATGEEAYSIAMVVSEAMGRPMDLRHRLRIFASDLHEPSLAIGRRAVYPASEAAIIPADLLQAYTRPLDAGIQVVETLRECLVFAQHDVTADPPFPRIDLVSCRNTLIYFTRRTQEQVVGAFEFSLKPDGLLFLGAAEALDHGSEAFDVVDGEHRIFRRTADVSRATWRAQSRTAGPALQATPMESAHAPSTSTQDPDVGLLEALLRLDGSSLLVFDDGRNLVRVVGDVSAFCTIPQGRLTSAGGSFLRAELQDEARELFLLSRADGAAVTGRSIRVEDIAADVRMRATPVVVAGQLFTVLSFTTDTDPQGPVEVPARNDAYGRELQRLERELILSQESLRRSMADLQAVNEELQASSEELQSSNEELQASNEELRATNDELAALNVQLEGRSDVLERLNTDLRNVQSSMSQGMVIVDRALCVVRFTPLVVRLFALVDADVGKPLLSVPTTGPTEGLAAALREVLDGSDRQTLECSTGSTDYLLQVLPYLDDAGARIGAVITLTDISEMVVLRREAGDAFAALTAQAALLSEQASTDALTGLRNRRFFAGALDRAIERAHRADRGFALVIIDLDGFKEVNDVYSHDAGDSLLCGTAERILGVVRASDTVSRLGGDEFGIVIEDFDSPTELDLIMERLRGALGQPVAMGEREVAVSASIGVAVYPRDGGAGEDLLRAADAAMYALKRQGGDGFAYFDASMNEDAGARRALRVEIADGLARSEFQMHYQPIVDAVTGNVDAVEALLRWHRGGVVREAGDFISFCEESGMIHAVGRAISPLLRADIALLRAAGRSDLRVAVNLSVKQLEERDLSVMEAEWASMDVPGVLTIEVVESVFLPDHPVALERVNEILRRGIPVAIDDFGSGYSNMRLLETLAPQYIKLDRTYLGSGRSASDRVTMIRSAVEVAHVVGAQVIAEGIETDEHRQIALDAGVDFVQGYGIARPMPMSALIQWLADNPPLDELERR